MKGRVFRQIMLIDRAPADAVGSQPLLGARQARICGSEIVANAGNIFLISLKTGSIPETGPLGRILRFHEKSTVLADPADQAVGFPGVAVQWSDGQITAEAFELLTGKIQQRFGFIGIFGKKMAYKTRCKAGDFGQLIEPDRAAGT